MEDKMTKTKRNFLIGLAGISLALGMMVVGCSDGGSSGGGGGNQLVGTVWTGDGLTVAFKAREVTVTGIFNFTAPYTLNGNEVTITVPASEGGGTAKGIINGNQGTVTYGQYETYKLTKVQ
jgi:hypothetical protein